MGNNSSKSNSNSLKSNSEKVSNSGKGRKLEKMNDRKENNNTTIKRVWIVKKAITLSDPHITSFPVNFSGEQAKLIKIKQNVFKIKNSFNRHFKHWATILELSNDTYVNIQFGRNGFSLEEFIKTKIEGENIFNAIMETWGEEGTPFSFCNLGNTNYKYEDLKKILIEIKKNEIRHLDEKGVSYYNLCFRNCQHFACDIERIIFGKIKIWHSFKYYLNEFFINFFPNLNINPLKQKYEKEYNEEFKVSLMIDIFLYGFQFWAINQVNK